MSPRDSLIVAALVGVSAALAAAPSAAAPRSLDAAGLAARDVERELAATSRGASVRLQRLPAPDRAAWTLELTRFQPFAPGFRLYRDGREVEPEPSLVHAVAFRGRVVERPGSFAALWLDPRTGRWRGAVGLSDALYSLDLAPGIEGASFAAGAVWSAVDAGPVESGGAPDVLRLPAGLRPAAAAAATGKIVVAPGAEYEAAVDFDSDHEFFLVHGSESAALAFFAETMTLVSALYHEQVGLSLVLQSAALYPSAADPWQAPDPHETRQVLCEVGDRWQRERPPAVAPRATVLFFTGKRSDVLGGQAWLNGACSSGLLTFDCGIGGYGVVVVTRPEVFRRLQTTAHELGHLFGTHHTHCYDPPIDFCEGEENGCYAGPESEPGEGGSVMSYCGNRHFTFGEAGLYGDRSERVPARIRAFVASLASRCLTRTNDPYALHAKPARGAAVLTWKDVFGEETNWLVEQLQPSGAWKQVRSLPRNKTRVTIGGLRPGRLYAFRLRAKFKRDWSDYSAIVEVVL